MSWVKMDDGYPEHPKVDRAGPMAAWLNVCAWSYCARNLTDGFVPAERIARLANVPNAKVLTQKLVDAQLWEVGQDGFWVHDYLVYNPSKAQVLAERAATAKRVADHRNRSSNGVTPPDTNGGGNGVATPVGNGVSTTAPYPAPSRTPKTKNPPTTSVPPAGGQRRITEADEDFKNELEEQFWQAFGSREAVHDCIDTAMAHKARLKCSDQRAYLRNWVRTDAERRGKRQPPARPTPITIARPSPTATVFQPVQVACEDCGAETYRSDPDSPWCYPCLAARKKIAL